jgi:hypothetical protein
MPIFVYIDGSVPPSFSYRTHAESSSDLSTYTFTAQDIGTASATRYVVVGIAIRTAGANPTFSSVTIGGVSATLVVQAVNSVSDWTRTGIFIAAVTTGTTGDVVVTLSSAAARCGISVYALYDLTSATAITSATSTASPGSLNVNVTPGKVLVAHAYDNSNTAMAWTGATEDFDVALEGGQHSSASLLTSTTETPRTVSVSYGTGSVPAAVAALFG